MAVKQAMGEIQLIKININIYCITKRNFKFVRLKATIFKSWVAFTLSIHETNILSYINNNIKLY